MKSNEYIYYTKSKKSSIKLLYKVFLVILLISDIFLLIFYYSFKVKTQNIENSCNSKREILENENNSKKYNEMSINKRLINLISKGYQEKYLFSNFFQKLEDIEIFKNSLIKQLNSIKEGKNKFTQINKIIPLYIGNIDGDTFKNMIKLIAHKWYLFISIKTMESKFGFVILGKISSYGRKFHNIDNVCDKILIYSDKTKGFYKFTKKELYITFTLNENNLLNIGNGDVIIKNEYLKNGGYIRFPLQYFDLPDVNENIFTEINGNFKIKNIEVFSLYIS